MEFIIYFYYTSIYLVFSWLYTEGYLWRKCIKSLNFLLHLSKLQQFNILSYGT